MCDVRALGRALFSLCVGADLSHPSNHRALRDVRKDMAARGFSEQLSFVLHAMLAAHNDPFQAPQILAVANALRRTAATRSPIAARCLFASLTPPMRRWKLEKRACGVKCGLVTWSANRVDAWSDAMASHTKVAPHHAVGQSLEHIFGANAEAVVSSVGQRLVVQHTGAKFVVTSAGAADSDGYVVLQPCQ
jgi:hypothetical protein